MACLSFQLMTMEFDTQKGMKRFFLDLFLRVSRAAMANEACFFNSINEYPCYFSYIVPSNDH